MTDWDKDRQIYGYECWIRPVMGKVFETRIVGLGEGVLQLQEFVRATLCRGKVHPRTGLEG
jgi:hypothetical protein